MAQPPPRSLQACFECRRRKTKCDGVRPQCATCGRFRKQCRWPNRLAPGGYQVLFGGEAALTVDRQSPSPPLRQHNAVSSQPHQPSRILQQRLIELFSERHSRLELCGCVQIDSLYHDTGVESSDFLLYAVLSLAALYITDDEAKLDPRFRSSQDVSSHYSYLAEEASRRYSDQPSVTVIQANLSLGLYEMLNMMQSKAWMHIGLGVRMAQALRMRNECNLRQSPHQREIRRRTFWSCVVLERVVAYYTLRPQVIDVGLVGIHLPCTEFELGFGYNTAGPKLNELVGSDIIDGEAKLLPYFIKTVTIWGNIAWNYINGGRLAASRYPHLQPRTAPRAWWKSGKALKDWSEDTPAVLRWSADNLRAHKALGQSTLFINMHLLVQHGSFLAHQEYLPYPDGNEPLAKYSTWDRHESIDPRNAPSDEGIFSICLRGANNIAAMFRLINDPALAGDASTPSIFAGASILSAINVFLWFRFCARSAFPDLNIADDELNRSRLDADFLVGILVSWSKYWKLASTWRSCVHLLTQFYARKYSHELFEMTGSDVPDETVETVSPLPSPSGPREGDGYPDEDMLPPGTFYKVRLITGLILYRPDLYKNLFLPKAIQNDEYGSDQPSTLSDDASIDLAWLNDADSWANPLNWGDFTIPPWEELA